MQKNNQKGLVHILVVLILLAGLGATVYLSQHTQIFKPKAYEVSNGETRQECIFDPGTGRLLSCTCTPNENKNKITVLLKKNGIYDNHGIEEDIISYFEAVNRNLIEI